MICPRCKGQKRSIAHFNMGEQPHEWREIDCRTCHGSGVVTAQHMALIEEGQRRRDERIARDMSLREEARRMGLSPVDLSRMERGMQPFPTDTQR